LWVVVAPVAFALATTGCATKKYVRQQVTPVQQQLGAFEKKTNDEITYVNNQHKRDISALDERMSTNEGRIAQVAAAVQTAQGAASRAMQSSAINSTRIDQTSTAMNNLREGVANALNFQLVEQADVTFGFNRSTLTPAAKATLDQLAQRMQSMPRAVVELAGFTDPVGSESYNLALSRKRAWAVQRYLVSRNIPLRNIQIVGMGKDQMAPLAGVAERSTGNLTRAERHEFDRRVSIRVYAAGDLMGGGTASRLDQ